MHPVLRTAQEPGDGIVFSECVLSVLNDVLHRDTDQFILIDRLEMMGVAVAPGITLYDWIALEDEIVLGLCVASMRASGVISLILLVIMTLGF